MNLELTQEKKYEYINNERFFNINTDLLINQIKETFNRTNELINKYKGFERNDVVKTNPIIWEYGHILFFWEHMTIKNLQNFNKKDYNLETSEYMYDSFRINKDDRFSNREELLDFNFIKSHLDMVLHLVIFMIKQKNFINIYLIRLAHLHHEMHIESVIFTHLVNKINLPFINNISWCLNFYKDDIKMIKIPSGNFIQGSNQVDFTFDNELPRFEQSVNNFKVSKYCITNYQFLQFVESGGYSNKDYWLPEGYRYIQKNKLEQPFLWVKKDNEWYEDYFGLHKLRMDNPVVNITWYEARAFCKWKGGRLISESEWEYLTTFFDDNYKEGSNMDYKKKSTISVYEDNNTNKLGVVGLFGNCWEWCEDPIYPYDGFKIDPVYREMSYPFFGFKRVCRGGAWSSPSYLITKSYRNAQLNECNLQFIGFRLVTDMEDKKDSNDL
jgi:gamma-glutamyl hercynylcysteine S-oxide synthase